MNIIEVSNLMKQYKDIIAVNNISFNVRRGEILGILGPNGAGKTTTLKIMLSLIYPDKGEVFIDNLNIKNHRKKILQKVGGLLEGTRNFYLFLSPIENMEYFSRLKGLSFDTTLKNYCKSLLINLGLEKEINKDVRKLSRGMQQKVAVACAVMNNPDILLLDEPALGLDVETSNQIKNWLKNLAKNENKTILITSHNMSFIESICDRVLIIKNGRIVKHTTIKELKQEHSKNIYVIEIVGKLSEYQKKELVQICNFKLNENNGVTKIILFVENTDIFYSIIDLLKYHKKEIVDIHKKKDELEKIFLNLVKD